METPRRNRLDLNEPSELAIYNAMQEVEKMGADLRLTKVTILLSKAKDLIADFIDKKVVIKDKYTYLKSSETAFDIYKNNLFFGCVSTDSEAKYTCYALENFNELKFGFSATSIVLYLDGREVGELKVNQMLAKMITEKISTVFPVEPKPKTIDTSDIGWEYNNI